MNYAFLRVFSIFLTHHENAIIFSIRMKVASILLFKVGPVSSTNDPKYGQNVGELFAKVKH